MSTPALQLTGIGKSFGDVLALRGVDLSVQPGTVHCILGENGAGKSTLCNVVYGGLRPDTGTMTLAGRRYAPGSPAAAMADGVAMVHQHFSLIGTMTVAENVVADRTVARTSDRDITLYNSVGIGLQDLAAARILIDRARERGVGTEVDLSR